MPHQYERLLWQFGGGFAAGVGITLGQRSIVAVLNRRAEKRRRAKEREAWRQELLFQKSRIEWERPWIEAIRNAKTA